jgi:tripartite ATP-independent transporter DctM subunit
MVLTVMLVFFGLLLLGAPIIIAMGGTSMVWLLAHASVPNLVIAQKMFTSTDSFALMAVPFFMLAGQVMERTGITEDIVKFSKALVGHIRGGLAQTTIASGVLLAGISGSSNADASALGAMLLRGLKKGGYEEGWAAAIVAAAASLGPIIPPSIIMILYGNAAGINIGKLFVGGIVPGLLLAAGYMVIAYFYAKKRGIPLEKFGGFRNLFISFGKAIWALFMPLIIIGGILMGVFTATEAGVAAIVYGLIYGLVRRKMNFTQIVAAVRDACISSAGPIGIIAISSIFSYILAREGLTSMIATFCATYITSKAGMMLFVAAVCIVAGCFIDGVATMLLLTPIFLPIVMKMGINVQQFSIIFMVATMSGGLTPPVGSVLFVMAAIDNTPLSKIVKPILPFVAIIAVVIVLMVFFPDLTTWVPRLVGYGM